MSSVRALLLLGVLVACGYVALMLHATDGHFVAQSPDLYVVAQYARAMAEGHPFQYNVGEAMELFDFAMGVRKVWVG